MKIVYKHIILFLFLITHSMAKYQEVKIEKIDKEYQKILTKQQLFEILMQIKNQFESQLGFEVFDYSDQGLPIEILYVSESTKKKRLNRYEDDAKDLKEDIEQLQIEIDSKRYEIDALSSQFKTQADTLNEEVNKLNTQIKKFNKIAKELDYESFEIKKKSLTQKQKDLDSLKKEFIKEKSHFDREVKSFNRKIQRYNSSIRKYNALARRIETLSKTIVEVKGKTFINNITTIKTSYEYGQKVVSKNQSVKMEKIEIYGFDENLHQLRAILAHELGHLVGVDHINAKRALMNPLLQQNQVDQLELTLDDIKAFRKAFDY